MNRPPLRDLWKAPAFLSGRWKDRRRRSWSTPPHPSLLLQSNQKTSSASYLSEIRIKSSRRTDRTASDDLFPVSFYLSDIWHLPQGFSSTAYLLHRISRPSDWITDQKNTPVTSYCPTPVTTSIASRAVLTCNCDEQRRLWTSCQLRPTRCLNRTPLEYFIRLVDKTIWLLPP